MSLHKGIGSHYNVSLQTGIFPDMMKKAKIKPLFKKADRT